MDNIKIVSYDTLNKDKLTQNHETFNKIPENLGSCARCTTIRRVFANINFGNRRLLDDISKEAH